MTRRHHKLTVEHFRVSLFIQILAGQAVCYPFLINYSSQPKNAVDIHSPHPYIPLLLDLGKFNPSFLLAFLWYRQHRQVVTHRNLLLINE